MVTYGLWYFKPQNGSYEAFSSAGTPSQLEDRGFTYVVALHSSAKDENGNLLYGNISYSGYSYNDGYRDGASLGRWVDSISRVDYLVVIPVLIDESKARGVRGVQYWKGWVDGDINLYPELINKACDYLEAQRRATGFIWSQRAYYYNANISNINEVRDQCPEW